MRAFIKSTGCPLCVEFKKHLTKDIEVIDIDTQDGMVEYCNSTNAMTVPLLIDGKETFHGQAAIERLKDAN